MSTNFLPWNPTSANQQTDSTYSADSTRSGGALTDGIFASPLANKAYFQWSNFVAAFATMMVNKGYTINDAPFADLVAVLTNVKTSADFEESIITVSYATSVVFNAAQAFSFYLNLTGNVSAATLSNATPGQILTFIIAQDSVGGRTFPWPSNLSNTSPICAAANSVTLQSFIVLPSPTPGTIIPYGPQLWLTSSGLVIQPAGSVIAITSSGNVSNQSSNLTEVVDASSGNITRTLYSAIGFKGFLVNGKNLPSSPAGISNTVTYVPSGGQTIDTFPNFQVNPYNAISFLCTGSNWVIV